MTSKDICRNICRLPSYPSSGISSVKAGIDAGILLSLSDVEVHLLCLMYFSSPEQLTCGLGWGGRAPESRLQIMATVKAGKGSYEGPVGFRTDGASHTNPAQQLWACSQCSGWRSHHISVWQSTFGCGAEVQGNRSHPKHGGIRSMGQNMESSANGALGVQFVHLRHLMSVSLIMACRITCTVASLLRLF